MYRLIRDLHLYCGLFASPFVLVFAASVFFLNHGKVTGQSGPAVQVCRGLTIAANIADMQSSEAVSHLKRLLEQCRVRGEIGFIRNFRREQRLVIPVWTPGQETTVTIDLVARSATVTERRMGAWETIAYLHKSPGPHNVAIRGNWLWTRVWRWFADGSAYLLLFISATGVYLWLAIRAERRIGVALLVFGALSFFGTIYAIAS